MLYRSNAHTHTTFCDGKQTVEENVLTAIEKDFVSLGFSIHSWTPYEIVPVTLEKEEEYKAEVKRMQEKYAGQIEILLGIERDALFLEREYEGFEYIIDSTHWFEKDGAMFCADYSEDRMNEYVREHFGGDYYAYCARYFYQAAKMCAESRATFIGHIDLISKFNEGNKYFDEGDPRYLKGAFEALELAIAKNIPLEMNTGAISRGYKKLPYPNMPILKKIKEMGGEIILNSDAHAAAALDTGFELSMELAKAAGFDHVLRLRKNGWEEVGLK